MYPSHNYVVFTSIVKFQGTYHFEMCSGYIVMLVTSVLVEKPTITVGNGINVDTVWTNDKTEVHFGACPYLDTYTRANCCMHSNTETEVTIFRMVPIAYTM